MKPIELQPCPFCGSKTAPHPITTNELYADITTEIEPGWHVVCDATRRRKGCGATSGWRKTKHGAAIQWNRRIDSLPAARDESSIKEKP